MLNRFFASGDAVSRRRQAFGPIPDGDNGAESIHDGIHVTKVGGRPRSGLSKRRSEPPLGPFVKEKERGTSVIVPLVAK